MIIAGSEKDRKNRFALCKKSANVVIADIDKTAGLKRLRNKALAEKRFCTNRCKAETDIVQLMEAATMHGHIDILVIMQEYQCLNLFMSCQQKG